VTSPSWTSAPEEAMTVVVMSSKEIASAWRQGSPRLQRVRAPGLVEIPARYSSRAMHAVDEQVAAD